MRMSDINYYHARGTPLTLKSELRYDWRVIMRSASHRSVQSAYRHLPWPDNLFPAKPFADNTCQRVANRD